jgi:hypothetical protein
VSHQPLQNEFDVLRDVARRLDQAGIDYMLTGSLAMNFYAQPRMTRDIDVVMELSAADVDRVVKLFSPDYYVSRDAVSAAVGARRMFNLIHQQSVIKVDCIVRKDSRYRELEFKRRQRGTVEDCELWIVSKEDLILSKLCWALDSHSEMQLGDVRRLLATGCDEAYLNEWAPGLEVTALLEECRHD